MLEKLEEMSIRFQELNQKLSEPEVINNRALWQDLAKEHSRLSEIMEKYEEYSSVLKGIEDANELISLGDEEMKELAEAELEDLKPREEALEKELGY